MSDLIFIFVIILFVILLSSSNNEKDLSTYDDEPPRFKDYRGDEEPKFYHPVTGYKGTKAEMDAYIINREKELRNEQSNRV